MAAVTLAAGHAFDGAGLARGLCETLPPYAVPVFIRLREEQDTTGTFKYRKVDLKTDGFDPVSVTDPLYVLLDRDKGYERLTERVAEAIAAGGCRL